MSKFFVLIKQVYLQKVKSKSFILMTLLYLAVLSGVIFWQDIKEIFNDSEADQIALINQSGVELTEAFVSSDKLEWVEDNVDGASSKVKSGDYLAMVTLTETDNKLSANITSQEPLKLTMQTQIEAAVANAAQFYAMGKMDLTAEQANILMNAAPIIESVTLNEDAGDGKSTEEKEAGMMVSYVTGFMIYFFVITYLSMITTDIASEKGSRALEMLLVSVRPGTHFKAKITGVLLIALTQFLVLFAFLFGVLRFVKDGKLWSMFTDILTELNVSYIFYIVVFLFGTIILFLIIGAMFGSLVSKVEEASQVMMPAVMITLIGFYVMISGLSNPDTMLIKIFSYIPFTSGMVMPMRIGATDLAAWEPLLSLGILVVSIVVMYFFTLSFYKRSVLTYSSGGIMQKLKSVFKFTT